MKATVVLFFFLGMNSLLFCINPKDRGIYEDAYMMTNAILKGSQVNHNGRPYPIKARYKEICLFDLNWMRSLKTFFYSLFQLA